MRRTHEIDTHHIDHEGEPVELPLKVIEDNGSFDLQIGRGTRVTLTDTARHELIQVLS